MHSTTHYNVFFVWFGSLVPSAVHIIRCADGKCGRCLQHQSLGGLSWTAASDFCLCGNLHDMLSFILYSIVDYIIHTYIYTYSMHINMLCKLCVLKDAAVISDCSCRDHPITVNTANTTSDNRTTPSQSGIPIRPHLRYGEV